MRLNLLLTVLLISISSAAMADDSSDDLVLSTLRTHRLEIRVIGALKFCEKTGLVSAIMQKISDSIVARLVDAKDPELEGKGSMLIQLVDVSAIGVATGLSLAEMDASKKKAFCSMAIDLADSALSKKSEP